MPKLTETPRFREHSRAGKNGQVWISYFWDTRRLGIPDIPLGSDREEAMKRYVALESRFRQRGAKQTPSTNQRLKATREKVKHAREVAKDAIALMRTLINAGPIRPGAGVYFLLDAAGEIVYVGQANNVLNRLGGHKEKDFTNVRMIHIADAAERSQAERHFIQLLRPKLNIMLVATGAVHKWGADAA